ncbi:MAG TPA: HepT-like ribonuclease domain-containing protein [Bryobacteraceae bacterium]|nr:HepT-like ribonuclease domain-containing protein [Bryobacteraceae bacterium]
MPPDEGGDANALSALVSACTLISIFVADFDWSKFERDELVALAVCFQLVILGEAVKRLSDNLPNAHSEGPWRDIAGMRDQLAHRYDRIDRREVWRTAVFNVPMLVTQLRLIQTIP